MKKVPNLLRIEDLSVIYQKRNILKNIFLDVNEGEIVGLIGESGSGKSTMLSAILGMLNNDGRVLNGKIYYKEKNLLSMKRNDMRHILGSKIGIVYQNATTSLNPIKKIGNQFYDVIRAHKDTTYYDAMISTKQILKKLELNNIEDIMNLYPFELSGGMNQRISIGLAMVLEPELLLVDEPTSSLDIISQKKVIHELKLLRDSLNTAIILVTHNINVASDISDRIVVMHEGNIIDDGEPHMIIKTTHPYTRRLIKAVPKLKYS